MTPKFVRVSKTVWSIRSTRFQANGSPMTGILSVDYEQRRTRKIIASRIAGAPPLGRTTGLYSVPTMIVRMLKEDSGQFTAWLTTTAVNSPANAGSLAFYKTNPSYADPLFSFSIQCSEGSDPFNALTVLASDCVIESKKSVYDSGVGALADEFTISALSLVEQDITGQRMMYSTVPNALDALAQDWVTIGGDRSPGRATILDPKREIGWDVRQAYAYDKATLVPKGNPPATFAIRFDFWDPSQLPLWTAFSSKYLKRSGVIRDGKAYALAIAHPILQTQPIALQECVVSKIGGLNKSDEEGTWGSTIDFLEYGQPKIVAQKPPPVIGPAGANAFDVPTAQQDTRDELLGQFQALSAGAAKALTR